MVLLRSVLRDPVSASLPTSRRRAAQCRRARGSPRRHPVGVIPAASVTCPADASATPSPSPCRARAVGRQSMRPPDGSRRARRPAGGLWARGLASTARVVRSRVPTTSCRRAVLPAREDRRVWSLKESRVVLTLVAFPRLPRFAPHQWRRPAGGRSHRGSPLTGRSSGTTTLRASTSPPGGVTPPRIGRRNGA